jgi:hypothetical protein
VNAPVSLHVSKSVADKTKGIQKFKRPLLGPFFMPIQMGLYG